MKIKWGWLTRLVKWAAKDPRVQDALVQRALRKIAGAPKVDEKQPVPVPPELQCTSRDRETNLQCIKAQDHGPMHQAIVGARQLNWWP